MTEDEVWNTLQSTTTSYKVQDDRRPTTVNIVSRVCDLGTVSSEFKEWRRREKTKDFKDAGWKLELGNESEQRASFNSTGTPVGVGASFLGLQPATKTQQASRPHPTFQPRWWVLKKF